MNSVDGFLGGQMDSKYQLNELRRECYFFKDGKAMFENAKLYFKYNGGLRGKFTDTMSALDWCIKWSETGNHDYWRSRCIEVEKFLQTHSREQIPNNVFPLFVEVSDD